MNIFYKHNNLKDHIIPSGLYQDLAFCGHNERIAYLQDAIDLNLEFAKSSKNAERISKSAIKFYNRIIKVCHNHKDEPAVALQKHFDLADIKYAEMKRKNKK